MHHSLTKHTHKRPIIEMLCSAMAEAVEQENAILSDSFVALTPSSSSEYVIVYKYALLKEEDGRKNWISWTFRWRYIGLSIPTWNSFLFPLYLLHSKK